MKITIKDAFGLLDVINKILHLEIEIDFAFSIIDIKTSIQNHKEFEQNRVKIEFLYKSKREILKDYVPLDTQKKFDDRIIFDARWEPLINSEKELLSLVIDIPDVKIKKNVIPQKLPGTAFEVLKPFIQGV